MHKQSRKKHILFSSFVHLKEGSNVYTIHDHMEQVFLLSDFPHVLSHVKKHKLEKAKETRQLNLMSFVLQLPKHCKVLHLKKDLPNTHFGQKAESAWDIQLQQKLWQYEIF